ncbi:polysaccharide deacetylase family protein [Flavobacterium faecale]|uniref:polysaccharide deacetylase family protein n=1 Tax=Flavobacterium faecale TaxID=1355330 RepID=UPI003AAEF79D
MKLLKCCSLVFLVVLFSCSKDDTIEEVVDQEKVVVDGTKIDEAKFGDSGVVLTFDDDYVENWKMADTILKEFHWKATFCVCKISQMNPENVKTLQWFQKCGHEIAGHGANHVNTLDYIAANGFEKFYEDEIVSMMDKMKENGLNVSSFAYPYGARNPLVDQKLFNTFKVLRGTTYGALNPVNQACYFENSKKVVFGLGIDSHYPHFSLPYIINLIDYAEKNHKILILYSHRTVDVVTDNYQTKMENLVSICKYVQKKHMKFYTLSDLSKIKA